MYCLQKEIKESKCVSFYTVLNKQTNKQTRKQREVNYFWWIQMFQSLRRSCFLYLKKDESLYCILTWGQYSSGPFAVTLVSLEL